MEYRRGRFYDRFASPIPFLRFFFRSVTDSFVGLFARRRSSSAIRGAVYSATRVYSPCRFSAFYRRHTRQDEDIFGAAILILKSTPRSFERRSESQEFEFPTFPATEIARLLYRRTYYAPLRSFHLISFSFVSSLGNIKYFSFFFLDNNIQRRIFVAVLVCYEYFFNFLQFYKIAEIRRWKIIKRTLLYDFSVEDWKRLTMI